MFPLMYSPPTFPPDVSGPLGRQSGSAGPAHWQDELASGAAAAGKAKSVICLFQHGGPSQMDLFDLQARADEKHDGKPYPAVSSRSILTKKRKRPGQPLQVSEVRQCGMETVRAFAAHRRDRRRSVPDSLDEYRSVDHESALRLIHTGGYLAGMPGGLVGVVCPWSENEICRRT